MISDKAQRKQVTLYDEVKIVESVDERIGSNNFSAALRYIINEWARLTNYQNGKEAEDVQDREEVLPQR